MSKHTPGPWILCFQDDDAEPSAGVVFATEQLVGGRIPSTNWDDAVAYCGRNHLNHEVYANARLIAAAPELLEALRDIVAKADRLGHDSPELGKARAAIAKTECTAPPTGDGRP
jgi:hypothetical protein